MLDILAIGSHPDDIEFACGGILARMAAKGKSIVMADLTLGEKGTNGTPEARRQEALSAAKIIDAERVFLDFKDCELIDSYEGRLKIVTLIRKYKPRLVLAPLWKGEQNHPDHLATGLMARYACRYARFAKILPELPIHRVEGILHYPHPAFEAVDFVMDVTSYVQTWTKMIRCHESQMMTLPYEPLHLSVAAKLGYMIGVPYAQGLVKGQPIVIDDLMHVAQGAREI